MSFLVTVLACDVVCMFFGAWVSRRMTRTVGVDYCTTHHGIRNEDMDRCDSVDDNDRFHKVPDRPCVLTPLAYRKPWTLRDLVPKRTSGQSGGSSSPNE